MGNRLLLRNKIEPSRRPRYDYYEDEDIVELQDTTLLSIKRHWSSYRGSFRLPSEDSKARKEFRDKLSLLIKKRLRNQKLWVVKDPRTAILLDDWINTLKELAINLRILIVYRRPTSNIQSFSSKGQVPLLWAESLWQRTYINALSAASQIPERQVRITHFDEMINNSHNQASELSKFLGLKIDSKLKQKLAHRVNPQLISHKDNEATIYQIHPTTKLLENCLGARRLDQSLAAEKDTISFELERSLEKNSIYLSLNQINKECQTLLPKARVTIVTAEFQGLMPCGGIGTAYRELTESLLDAGHHVSLILVSNKQNIKNISRPRLTFQNIDPSGMSRLQICRKITDHLKSDPCDVLHLHDWLGLGSGIKTAFDSTPPYIIVGVHGPSAWTRSGNPWPLTSDGKGLQVEPERLYSEGIIRALEEDTLQLADLIVAPSQYMAKWARDHFQSLQAKNENAIVVQRNCASTLVKKPINHQKCIGEGFTRLTYFGRLEERKGILLFLEAIKHISRRPDDIVFIGSDSWIENVGWGSEFAKQELESMNIHCSFYKDLGRKEALEKIYELGAPVVIPSVIENSPYVIQELLDTGIPLVTTNVGGIAELISDCCLAWLSEPKAASLGNHLQKVLDSNHGSAYQLKSRIPSQIISLSWQAFHERIPRREESFRASKANTKKTYLRRKFNRIAAKIATACKTLLSNIS